MKKNLFLVFVLLTALYACGVKSGHTTTTPPEPMSAEVAKGHELYTANCGRCHGLKEVRSVSVDKWNMVLQPMIKKAKMNEADGQLVEAYVWHELGVTPPSK